MRRYFRSLILGSVFLSLSAIGARADRIDGKWCSPSGQILMVDGSSVVTPGGRAITAQYNRHHVEFEIPEGEENAGALFSASQLNDLQIRVIIHRETDSEIKPAEIWTPCQQISRAGAAIRG